VNAQSLPILVTAVTDRRLTLNLRIDRNAPTTTLSTPLGCQSGFIHTLKWLPTNPSYYQSVVTIDHFPQLSRSRPLRCIERSFTVSHFSRMVYLSRLRLGKSVSVAIVSPATENSATAHPVPGLYFPGYRTSTATRQEQADAAVEVGTASHGLGSLHQSLTHFVSHPAFHCRHIISVKRYMLRDNLPSILCLRMRCVVMLCVLGP
jgi:hypothetical protein